MAVLRFLWLCGKPPVEDHGGAVSCASRAFDRAHGAVAAVGDGWTGR